MDTQRFDDAARNIGAAPSRRGLLRGLLAGVAVLSITTMSDDDEASARRRRRKLRPKAKGCPPCDICEACDGSRCVWICP